MSLQRPLCLLILALTLTACGKGATNNNPSGDGANDGGGDQRLSLTGADTAAVGGRSAPLGGTLVQDNNSNAPLGTLFAVAFTGFDNLNVLVATRLDSFAVFWVSGKPVIVSYLIAPLASEGDSGYTWLLDCSGDPADGAPLPSQCADIAERITLDQGKRTVSIRDLTLPVDLDDSSNLASAPMTVTGTLVWDENDDNAGSGNPLEDLLSPR